MNLREYKFYIILLALFSTLTSCNKDDDCCTNCYPSLYFYSLDRQGNNVLNEVVDFGTLYAFAPNGGGVAESWSLNPVPSVFEFPIDGVFDLLFIGNVGDKVILNSHISNRSDGKIFAVKSQIYPGFYNEVDRIYLGGLSNFASGPKHNDSINVLPQTGKISIKVTGLYADPILFKGALIIDNVASGIDLDANMLESAIQIRKDGIIKNNILNISAVSFPSYIGHKASSDPLTVSTLIFNKNTGEPIISAKKVLTERLTPNKHIIIEYEYKEGSLVEFDMIIKDWIDNEYDSGEAE